MRKFIFIFTITLLVITFFSACKKDNESMQTNRNNNISSNSEHQYTDYEWEVYYKLQSFKQKQNSNMRGNDPMTLDSARWYMETTFNVDEAYTDDTFRILQIDTTYYTLPLNIEGLVEFSDMNTMYNEMLSDMDSIEIIIANPDIFPVIGILEVVSNLPSEAYFSLTLGLGSYTGGPYVPIEEDDNWRWGNMKGHCDGSNFGESDAGQELINRLNNPLIAWSTPGSYIDLIQRGITYVEYPDVNNLNPDPDVGYMIYHEITNTSSWPCIEYDELDYYLDRLHEIIYTYDDEFLPNTTTLKGKRPSGLSFVPDMLTIYTPNGQNGSNYWWEHQFWVWYGTRVNLPPVGQQQ